MQESYTKLTTPPPPPYSETCSVPIIPDPDSILTRLHLHPGNRARCCGCGPKTWTKIIAALQIIICGICLIWRVSTIFITSSDNSRSQLHLDDDDDDELLHAYSIYSGYNSNPGMQAAQSFICLAFGCILYAGAHYGKPTLILIWLIMEGIIIGLLGIFLLFLIFFSFSGSGVAALGLVILLIPTALCIFCFYIVSRHRRQLIDHLNLVRSEHPTVQFHSVSNADVK